MNKPDYTASIAILKPNMAIPETLLHKLCSENRTATAVIVQDGKEISVEKFGDDSPLGTVEQEVAAAQRIFEGSKKFWRMFCFQNYPENFDKAEIQPWIALQDSKGNPLIVVCIEGDFPYQGNDAERDGMSEGYDVFHDYVADKITEMYGLLGNDWKKVIEYLKTTSFSKDIEKITGNRAVIAFMPLEGEPFSVGKNDIGATYDWGSVSNAYGYTESAVASATPAPAPKVKVSKFAVDDSQPQPQPIPDKKPAAPASVPNSPQPEIKHKPADPIQATADAIDGEMIKVEIPTHLRGKRKKAWVRDALGTLPKNWQNMTHVMVKKKTNVKSMAELAHTGLASDTGVKDMRPAAPTPVPPAPPPEKKDEQLPVISGQQQAKAIEFIKKYLSGDSNVITNPLEMQKEESKIALFSELCLDNKLDDINYWKTSGIFGLAKSEPEAIALLVIELRRDRMNRMQVSDLVGTGAVPTPQKDGTTKVETPTPGTPSPSEPPVHRKVSRFA